MILANLFKGFNNAFWEWACKIGRSPWVEVTSVVGDGEAVNFHTDLNKLDPATAKRLRRMLSVSGTTGNDVMVVETLGRLVADGPKVLRATYEQCEALSHVDINLHVGEYRQAFPVMLVAMPGNFVEQVRAAHPGFAVPDMVAVRWFQKEQVIFIVGFRSEYHLAGKKKEEIPADNCLVMSHSNNRFISNSLKKAIDIPDQEASCMARMYAVALNLMLLMTHFPFTVQPSNPAELDRAKRRVARGVRRTENELEVTSHVYEVALEQEIIVCETSPSATGDGTGTHASPHPHWRRGHWRRAPKSGQEAARTIFVRPCFVRAAAYVGKMEDTSAVYVPPPAQPTVS